jgi:hypothetical protein
MEHKVIQNLRAASGEKGLFRQWHQKFTTAFGQVLVHKLAREIDLGKDRKTVLIALGTEYGATLGEASPDVWKVLIDRAEAEAYKKVKTIPQGHGNKEYGVVYRWFTDVS